MDSQNGSLWWKTPLFVIVAALTGAVAFIYIVASPVSYGPDSDKANLDPDKTQLPSERSDLAFRNESFAKGELLIRENPKEAILAYRDALNKAISQSDIDSIEFRIALATYRSGDTDNGIGLFKNIVASSTISNLTRAYAVQFMAQEYFATNSQELLDMIFTGEYFQLLLQKAGGDKNKALRQLVEYGESLWPLPTIVLRVADYKAVDLLAIKDKQKNILLVNSILEEIRNRLAVADRGIDTLRRGQNIDQLPPIYNRKGSILTKVFRAGYDLGSPAEAYLSGVSFAKLYGDINTELFIYLNYATFLAIENPSKNIDPIKESLKNIYDNPDKNLKIFQFLKNEGLRSNLNKDIIKLSEIDPVFKKLLISLGWKF